MPQKTRFSACPPAFKVERVGEHSAKVTFSENAVEIKAESGSSWEADTYELITSYTVNIVDRIESAYDAWIKHAKDVDYEKNAPEPTLEERVAKVEAVIDGAPSLADAVKALAILLEA